MTTHQEPFKELERRVNHLRRREEECHKEWSRLDDRRFEVGAGCLLASAFAAAGLFRMGSTDPDDFFTMYVGVYVGIPTAIVLGVWWLYLKRKENRLLRQSLEINDELQRAEEAYYQP